MFSKGGSKNRFCKFAMNKKCNKEGTGLKLSSKYSQWVKKARHNMGQDCMPRIDITRQLEPWAHICQF